jgi:hypothetical protein
MELLRKVSVPLGTDGEWRVERMEVSKTHAELGAIRALYGGRGRYVPAGTYTALYHRSEVVMSDTPDELRDHYEPVRRANGRVFIAGLGLGCVLQAMLDKPEVEHATVVELALEVIRLVGPTYRKRYGKRLEIVHADIFQWKPPQNSQYSVAWFDVWNYLSTDNVSEMTRLKRKFSRRAEWRGCWSESIVRRQNRVESW